MKMIAGQTPGWTHCTVYLDGAKLERCTEADDQEGYALVHNNKARPHGHTDVLKGSVRFEFKTEEARQMAEAWQPSK